MRQQSRWRFGTVLGGALGTRPGCLVLAMVAVACTNLPADEAKRTKESGPADEAEKIEKTEEAATAEATHGIESKPPIGIDVSHNSGAVDWSRVHSGGYDFAYVKATEGIDLVDARFDEYWAGLKDAGLARGAYHFYVTEDDPEEQARFFLDKVHHEAGDLAPVVDVELIGHATPKGLDERLRKFLEIVETELGVKPIIYTSVNFWDAHIGPGFGDYPLWVAEYDVEAPRLPEGWERWSMWQWAENQPVAGVEKGADISHFNVPHVEPKDLLIPHRDVGDISEKNP